MPGEVCDDTLRDTKYISSTEKQADEWLRVRVRVRVRSIDQDFLHRLLPRLMWLLSVYEMPKTVKEWKGESISFSGSGSEPL